MKRHGSILPIIVCCLLSLWALYGSLELAEAFHVPAKVQTSGQDLDMDALLQLECALRPDIPSSAGGSVSWGNAVPVEPPPRIAASRLCPPLRRNRPLLSTCLYEYLCVYRI
ncbi:MAG: hypothetical protein C4293_12955 [Nitrospiraceae bacterium]